MSWTTFWQIIFIMTWGVWCISMLCTVVGIGSKNKDSEKSEGR